MSEAIDLGRWSDIVGLVVAFATICGVAIALIVSWRSVAASYTLVRYALFHGQSLSRWQASKEVARQLFFAFRTRSLYRAVRLSVELQILRPPPTASTPEDYSRSGIRAADREHRRRLRRWRHDIDRLMSVLIAEIDGDGPVIRLGEWFEMSAAEDRILRYFAVVNDREAFYSLDTDRFISTVELRGGAVAPLYLLRGLLHKFDEDWSPIVDSYGRSVQDPGDILRRRVQGRELREFQAYLFDCWLLWGPSVPICTCRQWGGEIAVQLGHGDENNSTPLLLEPAELRQMEAALQPASQPRPLAVPVVVHARIRYGRGIPEERLSPVQQNIRNGLALVAKDLTIRGSVSDRPSTYYSAYVWVMFVILRENGRPLFQKEVWRGLLPFFEHVNIADGRTLQVFKQQLAHKALSAMQALVQPGDRVRFGFAAATDESGCGHKLRFEPAQPTVRDIMAELLKTDYRYLRDSGIVDLSASLGAPYSACHLPDVLEDYFTRLDALSA